MSGETPKHAVFVSQTANSGLLHISRLPIATVKSLSLYNMSEDGHSHLAYTSVEILPNVGKFFDESKRATLK